MNTHGHCASQSPRRPQATGAATPRLSCFLRFGRHPRPGHRRILVRRDQPPAPDGPRVARRQQQFAASGRAHQTPGGHNQGQCAPAGEVCEFRATPIARWRRAVPRSCACFNPSTRVRSLRDCICGPLSCRCRKCRAYLAEIDHQFDRLGLSDVPSSELLAQRRDLKQHLPDRAEARLRCHVALFECLGRQGARLLPRGTPCPASRLPYACDCARLRRSIVIRDLFAGLKDQRFGPAGFVLLASDMLPNLLKYCLIFSPVFDLMVGATGIEPVTPTMST